MKHLPNGQRLNTSNVPYTAKIKHNLTHLFYLNRFKNINIYLYLSTYMNINYLILFYTIVN